MSAVNPAKRNGPMRWLLGYGALTAAAVCGVPTLGVKVAAGAAAAWMFPHFTRYALNKGGCHWTCVCVCFMEI